MVNINVIGNRISGSYGKEAFSVEYSAELFKQLSDLASAANNASDMIHLKEVYEQIKEATTINQVKIIETACPHIKEKQGKFYLEYNGVLSSVPMPDVLVGNIMECIDKNLPVDPQIKFWIRLLRNPNINTTEEAIDFAERVCTYISQTFSSRNLREAFEAQGFSEEMAFEMSIVQQTPLTMEGLICTKKVVTPLFDRTKYKFVLDENGEAKAVLKDGIQLSINEDTGETTVSDPEFSEDWVFEPRVQRSSGDAFYCGDDLGHILRVGREARLESWNQVDCDSHRSCVKGLHTGNQDYINSWESDDSVTLNMFVDPTYIGAIPYNDVAGVIRCLRYFPHSIKDRECDNKNIYHSSTYASQMDVQWDADRKEAVEKFIQMKKDMISKIDQDVNELNALG
jgi:hypothetical protein